MILAKITSSCSNVASIMVHLLHLPTRQTQTNSLTNSRLSVTCHLLTISSRGNDDRCSELLIQLSGNLCEHALIRQQLSQEHCVKIYFLCDSERDIDPSITQQHCRHSTPSLTFTLALKYSHAERTHMKKNNIYCNAE